MSQKTITKILCFEKNPDDIIKIIEELENSSSYSLIKKIAKSSLGFTNKGAIKESVRINLNSQYIVGKEIRRINSINNVSIEAQRINNNNTNYKKHYTNYKKHYNSLEKLSNLCIEYGENVKNIKKINLPLYEISNDLNKIIFNSIESYLKELNNLDKPTLAKYKISSIDNLKKEIKKKFLSFINTEYNLKLNKNDILQKINYILQEFNLFNKKNENTIKQKFLNELKEYNINYILILKFDKKELKNIKLIQEGGELVVLITFLIVVILVLIICFNTSILGCFLTTTVASAI